MPRWLSFLWSEEWGGAARGGGRERAGRRRAITSGGPGRGVRGFRICCLLMRPDTPWGLCVSLRWGRVGTRRCRFTCAPRSLRVIDILESRGMRIEAGGRTGTKEVSWTGS